MFSFRVKVNLNCFFLFLFLFLQGNCFSTGESGQGLGRSSEINRPKSLLDLSLDPIRFGPGPGPVHSSSGLVLDRAIFSNTLLGNSGF